LSKKNKGICSLVLLLLFFYTLPAFGETFRFSADSSSTNISKGRERTILSGNAVISSEDYDITAETIELYGDDFRYAVCNGNISVIDYKNKLRLTCNRLFLDREADIIRAEGNAVMEDEKNEIIVKGGFLENHDKDEVTIIQIGVRILKEDMICRSEFARYFRKDEILELSGLPVVFWKGDEYKATKITMNLDTEEISLEGEVRGSITSEDEEETRVKSE
jgi:lipopolysaccharide export system protein LptA